MTISWSAYAQSLTTKPVKAMLTGRVTILVWSFVRTDQPLADAADQVAWPDATRRTTARERRRRGPGDGRDGVGGMTHRRGTGRAPTFSVMFIPRVAAVLLAVGLLAGCGGQSEAPTAEPAASTSAMSSPENGTGETGTEDVCAAAAAALNGEATDNLQQGEIDAAIAAYDDLAAHAPPEIADDAATVRDGLIAIRDALTESGLDEETVAAFLSGYADAISTLGPEELAALQLVGADLTTFVTSTDYIEAAQHLVTYYSENCAQ